jgi:hypothetical protein
MSNQTKPEPKDEPRSGLLDATVGLRPCPFCGTKRIRIHEWIFGAVVICECGGRGPEGCSETKIAMACDLWNRREQPNDQGQLRREEDHE